MKLYTIGFTKKSAEHFFTLVQNTGIKRIVDIRLNNVSQLAGFTKRDDLKYFLNAICKIDYIHLHSLAPTKEMIDDFKKKKGSWPEYVQGYHQLLLERDIKDKAIGMISDGDCFLCSEETPDHCHRRLLAEYLKDHWGGIQIIHL